MGYTLKRKARYTSHRRRACSGGCNPDHFSRWHDSIEEANYCDQLNLLKKCGDIQDYVGQKIYYLADRNGKACGWMKVDFVVTDANGKIAIHEYKGSLFGRLPEYRVKKALFTWCYPDIPHITVGKNQRVIQ